MSGIIIKGKLSIELFEWYFGNFVTWWIYHHFPVNLQNNNKHTHIRKRENRKSGGNFWCSWNISIIYPFDTLLNAHSRLYKWIYGIDIYTTDILTSLNFLNGWILFYLTQKMMAKFSFILYIKIEFSRKWRHLKSLLTFLLS